MCSNRLARRYTAILTALLAWLLLGAPATFAQVDTGTILGTIQDPTGAVIPAAKVTLTNEGTGIALVTTSAADGTYIFTPIRIGIYSVTVEKEGFQTVVRPDVPLHVTEQVKVDVTLSPGQVTQQIEVTGAPPLLQTQTSSVGQTQGSQAINDLPLNGRNYTFLAQIGAGVTQTSPTGRGLEGTGSFIANGLPLVHNNYLLDGIDNNNDTVDFLNGAAFAVLPPPDALQEFKIQTSNFTAEFGRAGGAVVNATIKSGTNQLHGDIWEFIRNDKLDAANFFENSPAHVQKGEFRRNQFGGAIGGPVTIPHVYSGRDRTFFFFDFEGTRIRQAVPQLASVPTNNELHSGFTDFQDLITGQSGTQSDLLGRTFPLGTILDPATTRTVTAGQADPVTGLVATSSGLARDPFSTGSLMGATDFTTPAAEALLNMLPASRLDQNAIKILQLYPAPTGAGIFNNFSADRGSKEDTNHFDARVDQNFSAKDQLFGRVSFTHDLKFIPGPFTGAADGSAFNAGTFVDVNFNGGLSETHSFSSTLINELRLGYSRIHTTQLQVDGNNLGIPAQFGIQGIPQAPTNGGLPRLDISGLSSLGAVAFLPGNRASDTTQLTENFTKVYGSHAFKGGLEVQYLRHPWLAPAWSRGEFSFAGDYTEVPNEANGNTGAAQLLLSPTQTSVPNGLNGVGGAEAVFASNFAGPDDIRHYFASYFQDDWKVTPKLTLNLGLRWEYFSPIGEEYGAQANFIPNPPGSAQYLITTRRKNEPLSPTFLSTLALDGISLGYSNKFGLVNAPKNNFAPRVGLAYQVTPKLVVHAAYGIFSAGFEDIGGAPDLGENYPFLYDFSFFAPDPGHPITYPDGSFATLENGLAGVALRPTGVNGSGLALQGDQVNFKTPYAQEYNLTFQYQLSPNQTIQLGYLGNTSRHLYSSPGLNVPTVILPPGTNPQLYVPFPDFGRGATYVTNQANSYYNSIQLTFERRFISGLSILATYTYAKCRGDDENLLGIGNAKGYRAPYLPGFGIRGDYGYCGDDTTNVFHYSGTYQLPVGNGKRFAGSVPGALNQVIGGWSINWITTLESGLPFSIGCPIGTTADFGCYALLVPGQNIYSGPHNVNHFLNPKAFAQPLSATTVGQSDFSVLGGAPTQAHGPGYHRLDFSLFKNFQTTEKTHLEFRAEFFNLTNTPQFANPSFLDFTNTQTFGQITSLRDGANDPRQIQFALKFYW